MSIESGRRVLLAESEAVALCADRLDQTFVEAVDQVLACQGRVIACGLGKSGHIARKMAGTLSSTGTPSLFLHAAEAVHGDLGMIKSNDLVIMYSHSGESDALLKLFPSIQLIGATTILITGHPDGSVARSAGLVLNTHVQDEACSHNLAPTTSTTVMLALSDALAIAVMDRRKFSKEEFAVYHPSGALGKQLTMKVSHAMRRYEDIAVTPPEATMLEVMKEITKHGVGVACMVDEKRHLLGLISDGDLRRHIVESPGQLEVTAESMMNRKPSTIGPDLLASEALEVFQKSEKRIGDLPVVHDGKVVGLLMLKDLLRTGIG